MAQVTITLTDVDGGGVSLKTEFKPAIGAPCTPAQSEALDIMRRHRSTWDKATKPTPQASQGERLNVTAFSHAGER